MAFILLKTSKKTQARLGILKTAHGQIQTPFFMPIATKGSVKALRSEDIKKLGAEIILTNTYHLFFKPGRRILKKAGGIHGLMDWAGPVLTDSGGYQVFSLGGHKDYPPTLKPRQAGGGAVKPLVKITEQGAEFRSVYDGSKHLFTPKKVLKIQTDINSDIRMILDVCSPSKCSHAQAEKDLNITLRWAKISQTAHVGAQYVTPGRGKPKYLLFGIVQGALFKDLRLKSVEELIKMDFAGYAIGGLAVGESVSEMYKVLDYAAPALPADKPRYLMGVGYPEQIAESVKRGIDMFDCVIPTREARHGRLYLWTKQAKAGLSSADVFKKGKGFYKTINITSAEFAEDFTPINPKSKLPELRNYTKAYLRHLFSAGEPLALRLATLNNVEFYLDLMAKIRQAIKAGKL